MYYTVGETAVSGLGVVIFGVNFTGPYIYVPLFSEMTGCLLCDVLPVYCMLQARIVTLFIAAKPLPPMTCYGLALP